MPFQHIFAIVNPSSGPDETPVDEIRAHLEASGATWHLELTDPDSNVSDMARTAAAEGADVVVAFGGDGTVSAVAHGLMNTDVPLAIVPQGTANVLAAEFGIPDDLQAALDLITGDGHRIQQVDMGCQDDEYFMLRLNIGLAADMTVKVAEDLKKRYGRWAYLLTALDRRRRSRSFRYRITIDDQERRVRGVACAVCNSGNVGIPGLQLTPDIDMTDGLLDVVVVRRLGIKDLLSLSFDIVRNALLRRDQPGRRNNALYCWKGASIRISADGSQSVARDGEPVEKGLPINVHVVPGAVRVVVPKVDR